MAHRGGPRRSSRGTRAGGGSRGAAKSPQPSTRPKQKPQPARAEPAPLPAGPFRLGVIPGATPGRWIDTWHERMPGVELVLHPLAVADQDRALAEGDVDAALVRLPVAAEGLHVIRLYDEIPVVVTGADSHLTAADELTLDDLAGEIVVTPRDDVLGVSVPSGTTPSFAPPEDTEQAVATVAAGVGILIVPMSLARLHARKDVAHRPLTDGPTSTVALAWPAEGATELVEIFVGIVRGRTANSSR
ncbi:LysR substrate-binding domain-containing protein [Microbacterium aureliae]